MSRTMAYVVVARVHVAFHGAGDPSEREWSDYLADVSARLGEIDAVLSIAMCGSIDSKKRAQAVSFWKTAPKTPRIAVVTPSMLVVRAAGALRWFMPSQIKAFALGDVEGAYTYLGLKPQQRRLVAEAVRTLEATLALEGSGNPPGLSRA
jgi:hypothetical protein